MLFQIHVMPLVCLTCGPQDVIRNWHSREVSIVQTVRGLVENAQNAKSAVEAGKHQWLVH